jgi:hypothetical protein
MVGVRGPTQPSEEKGLVCKTQASGHLLNQSVLSRAAADPDQSQFEKELAALKEANRLAYSRRTPWRTK